MVRNIVGGLAVWGVALAGSPAQAQPFEAVGIRAQGMAGAFVAVADDATAVYWNPGGLAAGALVSAVAERSNLDLGRRFVPPTGVGIPVGPTLEREDGDATLVALGLPPVGVAYYRVRTTSFSGELTERRHEARGATLVTDNLAVNVLQSLADGVHVGATLRAVHGSAGAGLVGGTTIDPDDLLDLAADVERRGSWGFDVDAGVLVDRGRWRVGLTARNLVAPSFDTLTPDVALTPSRQVRAGVAFRPRDGSTLAVDADLTRTETGVGDRRALAVGVDQAVASRLVVRGGVRFQTVDDVRPAGAVGASLGLTSSIWVDTQVTRGGDAADRGWSIGLRFTY